MSSSFDWIKCIIIFDISVKRENLFCAKDFNELTFTLNINTKLKRSWLCTYDDKNKLSQNQGSFVFWIKLTLQTFGNFF